MLSNLKEQLDPYAFAAPLLEDPQYNTIALAEEVGECLGKYKKHIRDGLVITKPPHNSATVSPLAVELGDVLFYWTYLVHSHGLSTNDFPKNPPGKPGDTLMHLGGMYNRAARLLRPVIHVSEDLLILYDHWHNAVESIGYTPDEILAILIHKISSRQERGVQAGSGDNR